MEAVYNNFGRVKKDGTHATKELHENEKLEAEYCLTNVADFFVFSNKEMFRYTTSKGQHILIQERGCIEKVVSNCCNGVFGVAALLVSNGSDLKLILVAINGNRLM
nr:hypothetical protein [Tanacetum cinerariifolium]